MESCIVVFDDMLDLNQKTTKIKVSQVGIMKFWKFYWWYQSFFGFQKKKKITLKEQLFLNKP